SWEEHVVLAYQLAQGRDPTPLELQQLSGLRDELGLSRSAALALALRGSAPELSWERAAQLAAQPTAFRSGPRTRQLAARLAATPRAQALAPLRRAAALRAAPAALALATAPPAAAAPAAPETYHTYYGYLHAHSYLSDGTGWPTEAYAYA